MVVLIIIIKKTRMHLLFQYMDKKEKENAFYLVSTPARCFWRDLGRTLAPAGLGRNIVLREVIRTESFTEKLRRNSEGSYERWQKRITVMNYLVKCIARDPIVCRRIASDCRLAIPAVRETVAFAPNVVPTGLAAFFESPDEPTSRLIHQKTNLCQSQTPST